MRKIRVCLITFIALCVLIRAVSAQQSRSNRKKSRSNLQKDSIQNYNKDTRSDGFSTEKEKSRIRPDTLKKRRKGSHQRNDYG